jgi:hypothetical protein
MSTQFQTLRQSAVTVLLSFAFAALAVSAAIPVLPVA